MMEGLSYLELWLRCIIDFLSHAFEVDLVEEPKPCFDIKLDQKSNLLFSESILGVWAALQLSGDRSL